MIERWLPATEDDLVTALDDGRLDEGQHLDFKRELQSGKKANLELARDLAMFANDGGALILGVDEPTAGQFATSPVALDGQRERIEQVATSRLDPPLHVDVHTIPTGSDPARGYLVVRVPASPEAPHMVSERYYGRAGTTRSALADAQVRAIIASRQVDARPIEELLERDIARDPIPADQRTHAHLHVVARPRYPADDLVLADVDRVGGNWSTWFHKELLAVPLHPRLGSWAPDLKNQASNVGRRAHGAAIYSYHVGQDRSLPGLIGDAEKLERYEDDLLDLEVDEDGTLHLFCGRGSDTLRDVEVLIPAVVAGLVLRVVQVATRVSDLTGYVGTWDFATAVTGLRGVSPHVRDFTFHAPAYSADSYRTSTAADTAELQHSPRRCADRLVGRLLRGLGQDGTVDAIFPRPATE